MTEKGKNMATEQNGGASREKKKLSVRIHSYPCTSCGHLLSYVPGTSLLRCSYCKSEEAIKEELHEVPEYIYDPTRDDWDAPEWEKTESYVLPCPSCGAEILSPMQAVTVTCPFCETDYVSELPETAEVIPPTALTPFRVSEEAARESFNGWAKKRFWAPFGFKKRVKAAPLRGMYIPAWTFDTDLSTSYSGFGGRRRIITRTVRRNGKTVTETRTVIDWYPISGVEQLYTDDILISASKKIDRALFSKLSPYSTKVMNVYDPAYLAGLSAERYDVGPSDAFEEASRYAKSEIESYILRSRGFDTYRGMSYRHDFQRVTFKEILLPVFRSSYTYHKKQYAFLVNGESGKICGKYPVSVLKVLIAVLLGLGIVALAVVLILLYGG